MLQQVQSRREHVRSTLCVAVALQIFEIAEAGPVLQRHPAALFNGLKSQFRRQGVLRCLPSRFVAKR